MLSQAFNKAWKSAREALVRFPLAMISSLGAMVFFLLYLNDPDHGLAGARYRIGLTFLLGIPLFTLLSLVGEALVGRFRMISVTMGAMGLLLLEGYRVTLPYQSHGVLFPRMVQLGAVLLLLLAMVPVFFQAARPAVFTYLGILGRRLLRASGLFVMLSGAAFLGVFFVCSLADLPFSVPHFERLTFYALFVVCVWYLLAGVPASFEAVGDRRRWEPWNERLSGGRVKGAAIGLCGICLVAMCLRIPRTGFDLTDYFLLAVALWAAGVWLYYARARRPLLRIAPLSLAALLALTSFGPWGAYGVVEAVQTAHLGRLLEEVGAMRGERISRPAQPVDMAMLRRISRRMDYMNATFGYPSVHRLIWPGLKEGGRELASEVPRMAPADSSRNVMRILGLKYVQGEGEGLQGSYRFLRSGTPDVRIIRGWDLWVGFTPMDATPDGQGRFSWGNRSFQLEWSPEREAVLLKEGQRQILELPVGEALERARTQMSLPVITGTQLMSPDQLTVEAENRAVKARLTFGSITARAVEGKDWLDAFSSEVFVKFKKL